MALYFLTLLRPSAVYTVEVDGEGFLISPTPGRQEDFNHLAEEVTDRMDDYAAFPRIDVQGDCSGVYIVPTGERLRELLGRA